MISDNVSFRASITVKFSLLGLLLGLGLVISLQHLMPH